MNSSKLDNLNDLFDLCDKVILDKVDIYINLESIEDLTFDLDSNFN